MGFIFVIYLFFSVYFTKILNSKIQCVKSVRIRSFSGSCFPAFGLNTKDSENGLFHVLIKKSNQSNMRIYAKELKA